MRNLLLIVSALLLSACGGSMKLAGLGGSSSSSDAIVELPNVFGLPFDQAKVAFSRAGVEGEVQRDTSLCGSAVDGKIIELGQVCYQSPGAGQKQYATLVVSVRVQTEDPRHGGTGIDEWRLMPDVTGMTVTDARAALRAAGFPDADTIDATPISEPGCASTHVCHTFPERLTRSGLSSSRAMFVGE